MTETGRVIDIDDKKKTATVRFERRDACAKCRMCAMRRGDMFVKCKVANTLSARVGDDVAVEMGDRAVLTAAFVVYIIPLLLMLIGLLCAKNLSDGAQTGIAMGALALGFAIAVGVDRAVKKKKNFAPRMTEIIKSQTRADENDLKTNQKEI